MRSYKALFNILTFLALSVTVLKSENQPTIDHITSNNGLSHNTIRCMLQDTTGFLWFGSLNGLNRYDGHKIKTLNPGNLPVIVTGDFNLTPESEPITLILEKLKDSSQISAMPPYGPVGTFNSFRRDHPLDQRIDYIFVNDKVSVLKYGVLTDGWDNRYPSDHQPVMATVKLNKK